MKGRASDLLADGRGLVVIHEQVGELGGSERVLGAILERFPAARLVAPRFTTTNLPGGDPLPWPNEAQLIELGRPRRHFLGPLYSRRIAAERLEPVVLVLSLTQAGWSLAARVPPGVRFVTYCSGLSKPLYGHAHRYLGDYAAPLRPLLRASIPLQRAYLGRLMRRPHRLLTNSAHSARELARVYGRTAEVVHPPVRTDFFTPAPRERQHVLAVARLAGHKRIDLLVDAFRRLEGELVVAGGGGRLPHLRATAPANVRFTGYVDDERLRELYRSAQALVCPSVEEFGIVMAEALATGTPVIAPRAGGALEIVEDGVTGILLERVDADSIAEAVRRLPSLGIEPARCRASIERFGEARFATEIERVVGAELELEAPGALGLASVAA